MPYVFDQINGAMGGGSTTDQSGQSSIFGGAAPGGAPAGGAAPQAAPDAPPVKTSSSAGDSGGQTQTSGAAPSTQQATGATAPAADAKAYMSNSQSSANANAFLDPYKKSATDVNTNLQNEADGYVKGAVTAADTGTAYTPPTPAGQTPPPTPSAPVTPPSPSKVAKFDYGTIDKALGGDKQASSDVTSRLTAAAPTVAAWQPQTDTHIKDLDNLASPDRLTGALYKGGNENYNQGMAAFDAMLLNQNKDFQAGRSDLVNQQAAIDNKMPQMQLDTTGRAQTQAKSDWDAGTSGAKDYLTGKEGEVTGRGAAAMADYNAKLAALRAGGDKSYLSAQSQAALQELGGRDMNGMTDLNRVDNTMVDPSKYFHVSADATDPTNFYTGDDANRFNTIEGLLGTGKQAQVGAGPGATESFDKGGYEAAMSKGADSIRARDAAANAALDAKLAGLSLPQADPQNVAAGAPAADPNAGQDLSNIAKTGGASGAYGDGNNPGGNTSGPVGTVVNTLADGATKAGDYLGVPKSPGKIFSDRSLKTDIKTPATGDLHDFLDKISPKSYSYKDPSHGPGQNMGVMAQDLEKHPIGAVAVSNIDGKKAVDYSKLFPTITATIADQHKRIKKLEGNS